MSPLGKRRWRYAPSLGKCVQVLQKDGIGEIPFDGVYRQSWSVLSRCGVIS